MHRLRLPLEIPGTQRGTFVYHINDGYTYHKNRVYKNRIVYFKCAKYETTCYGRAQYSRKTGFVSKVDTHSHPPDPLEVQVRQLKKAILDRCKNYEYISLRTILNEERDRYPIEVGAEVTMARMRPAMQRIRTGMFPPHPQDLRTLTNILRDPAHRIISMTRDGQENLYAGSVDAEDGTHCIIFFSPRMAQAAVDDFLIYLFGDGTFTVLPAIEDFTAAAQVYSIVGNWNHVILPIATVLMERRTEAAYEAVLERLRELLQGGAELRFVMTDYEQAAQNAWETVFPNAILVGCFFHVVHAYVRYAREELHMTVVLREEGPIRRIFKMCCAIPLLRREHFTPGFHVLMQEARQEGMRIYRVLRPFFAYLWRNWVGNPLRRRIMSVYGKAHRTNNTCESHHRQLRNYIPTAHPNVYHFIAGLARIESASIRDVRSVAGGNRPNRRRKASAISNDRRLRNIAENLRHHEGPLDRALLRFLRAASYTFENAFEDAVNAGG